MSLVVQKAVSSAQSGGSQAPLPSVDDLHEAIRQNAAERIAQCVLANPELLKCRILISDPGQAPLTVTPLNLTVLTQREGKCAVALLKAGAPLCYENGEFDSSRAASPLCAASSSTIACVLNELDKESYTPLWEREVRKALFPFLHKDTMAIVSSYDENSGKYEWEKFIYGYSLNKPIAEGLAVRVIKKGDLDNFNTLLKQQLDVHRPIWGLYALKKKNTSLFRHPIRDMRMITSRKETTTHIPQMLSLYEFCFPSKNREGVDIVKISDQMRTKIKEAHDQTQKPQVVED